MMRLMRVRGECWLLSGYSMKRNSLLLIMPRR